MKIMPMIPYIGVVFSFMGSLSFLFLDDFVHIKSSSTVYSLSYNIVLDFCRYLHNMRAASSPEKAGGYEAYIGCIRALQSAVEGLYLGLDEITSPTPSHAGSSGASSETMDGQ